MLDERQRDIINDIVSDTGTTRKRTLGVSGTGKTYTIANCAAKIIKKNPDAKILITYYNMSLHWRIISELEQYYVLKHRLSLLDKDSKVKCLREDPMEAFPPVFVMHKDLFFYHAFPRKPLKDDPLYEPSKNVPGRIAFDYIFVDEGQDFDPSDIKELISYLRSDKSKLCFFADKRQRLYNFNAYSVQEEAPENMVPTLPRNIGFRGPWCELNTVHRTKGIIARLAEQFAEKCLSSYGIGGKPQNEFKNSDEEIFYTQSVDRHHLFDYIQLFLDNSKWNIDNTALLFLENKDVVEAAALFPDSCCTFDKSCIEKCSDDKNAGGRRQTLRMNFRTDKKGLKISTVKSFKGLDIENVIFCHDTGGGYSKNSAKDAELCYVGLSRATKRLLIIDLDIMNSPLSDIYGKYTLPVLPNFRVKRMKVTIEQSNDDIPW